MRDDVLNIFVHNLVSGDIDDETFEEYIDLFSKFLSYTNSDYKYNGTMPNITPHVCRHTYCFNMAKSGMNPKTL